MKIANFTKAKIIFELTKHINMKKLGFRSIMLAGMLACAFAPVSADNDKDECCDNQDKCTEVCSNDVVKTIMARRSIRKYKEQPVEDAKINAILKCGINAPTGMYKQSWQVRVVRNPEFLDKLDKGFTAQRVKMGKKGKARACYGAPCLIFIAYDPGYDMSQVDCGLLGENIVLSAQSMGLGTCCLGQVTRFMMSEDGKELLSQLEIPSTHRLLYAIALGYPDEAPDAKPRDMGKVKFID